MVDSMKGLEDSGDWQVDALADPLAAVATAVEELGHFVDQHHEECSTELLVLALWHLDRPMEGLYQQLAAVVNQVKTLLYERLPSGGPQTFQGIGTLEKCRTGKRESWDGPALAGVIAAQCADDVANRETGELPPVAAICHYVAQELVECAGLDAPSKSWRKTDLKARGIKPSKYLEVDEEGRPAVRWR